RELRDRGTRKARDAVRTLAHAGKEALSAGRAGEAVQRYREAATLASRSALPHAERAQGAHGLRPALLRKGDAARAPAALAAARRRLRPGRADSGSWRGVAKYERGLPGAEAPPLGSARAPAPGPGRGDAEGPRRYLGAIAGRADQREGAVLLDARAAAGYDSN